MKKLSAILATAALLALAVTTRAQVTTTTPGSCLSNIVTIGNTVSSNLASTLPAPIEVVPGKGISFTPYYAGGQSTNTGLMAFGFAVSTDGTNYTTTTPIWATSTGTGAAAVRDYIYVPATSLGAARKIKLATITNALVQKITTTVTNVYYAIDQ